MQTISLSRKVLSFVLLLATATVAWLSAGGEEARAAGKLAALVTDAPGKVELQSGSKWMPAPIMTQVPPGSSLRLASGARATLSFVQGGLKGTLVGPCTVRVDSTGVALLQGAASSVKVVQPDGRATALLPANINMDRMGGSALRGGGDLNLTIDAFTASTGPMLTWTTDRSYDRFEISVVQSDNQKEVFHGQAPAGTYQIQVPPGKLAYGQEYDVTITGYTNGSRTVAGDDRPPLKVLDKAQADRLAQAQAEADAQLAANKDDVSPLVILMALYQLEGLYTPAITTAERIRVLRPNERYIYEALKNLYAQKQDMKKAAEMENQARKLAP